MYLISVSPIARGITKETLTYFSKDAPPLGSIVSVPLRSKKIKGLVIAVKDAQSERTHIKSLAYELKRAEGLQAKKITRQAFIEAGIETANWYASTLGSVLWSILPHSILLSASRMNAVTEKGICPIGGAKKICIKADNEERWSNYRSSVRACFARSQSVFVAVPTIEDAEYIAAHVGRGIEQYTYVLHSDMPQKKILETWNTILTTKHSVMVIGTPAFLSVPREDIGLIIIEREHSRAYRMQSRPFVDLRRFVETYADMIGADVVRGDTVISVESWWRATKSGEQMEYHEEPSEHEPILSLVDMSAYKVEAGRPFTVLSDEVLAMLTQTTSSNGQAFLFTPRRGLYPTTVCADCGKTVTCARCKAPVVVHKNPAEENFVFICHHCGNDRPTEERCVHCGSWRLATLGVGLERVTEEVQKQFPQAQVFVVDKHSEPTRAKVKKTIEAFYNTPGAILIGTEYALLYLRDIQNSAVISLDSLFLIPDFRMHERILGTLSNIKSRTTKKMLIQTRDPSHILYETLSKKTYRDFYLKEIELRKALGYPPFTIYIKVTRLGKQENIEHDLKILAEKLKGFQTIVFPGHIEKIKGLHVMHLIIKLRPDQWINDEIATTLRTLPPSYTVKVDPETLL